MTIFDYDYMKLYRENERIRLFPLFVKRIDAEIAEKNREMVGKQAGNGQIAEEKR